MKVRHMTVVSVVAKERRGCGNAFSHLRGFQILREVSQPPISCRWSLHDKSEAEIRPEPFQMLHCGKKRKKSECCSMKQYETSRPP